MSVKLGLKDRIRLHLGELIRLDNPLNAPAVQGVLAQVEKSTEDVLFVVQERSGRDEHRWHDVVDTRISGAALEVRDNYQKADPQGAYRVVRRATLTIEEVIE